MRDLAEGPRQSGRTTTLIMTMIEEMEMHEEKVYLVVGKYCLGHHCKDVVKRLNGDPSRVRPVSLESIHILNGIDPRNIYIEHTAYDNATSKQLSRLYEIESERDNMIWSTK